MAKKVKDLSQWMNTNEAELKAPKDWRINPNFILEQYKKDLVDKETAIYLLKEMYYTREASYNNISFRKKCLKGIVDLSKKDKELELFLEQAFITEYWYKMRLYALQFIAKHFKKLGLILFNHISEQQDDFLKYALEREAYSEISFLPTIVNDYLVKLFVYLKENRSYYKINFIKRKIQIGDWFLIQFHNFKEFKKAREEALFTEKQILQQPIRYFVWKERFSEKAIYIDDSEERNPIYILYTTQKDRFYQFIGINKSMLDNLIESIRKVFDIKSTINFSIVKTSIYYLIAKIEEVSLYVKIKLSDYLIEKYDIKEKISEQLKKELPK